MRRSEAGKEKGVVYFLFCFLAKGNKREDRISKPETGAKHTKSPDPSWKNCTGHGLITTGKIMEGMKSPLIEFKAMG